MVKLKVVSFTQIKRGSALNNGNMLKQAPLPPLGGDLMLSTAAPTQFVTALCVGASVVHVKVFSSRS